MQVIAQYYAVAGEHHKSEEDILVIFNKKVNNNPKFKVLKESETSEISFHTFHNVCIAD